MDKLVLTALAVLGGVFIASAGNVSTNRLMIGDKSVPATVVDGKIVGDRLMVISNSLIQFHAEVTRITNQSSPPDGAKPATDNNQRHLRLLFSPGTRFTHEGHAQGMRGLIYMSGKYPTPALARTTLVEILASGDNAHIVVMVATNGPIYSSTNSGMTWAAFNLPGKYEFPLDIDTNGTGYIAAAKIHPSSAIQTIAPPAPMNWYAVGASSDGSKLVLSGNTSQAVPALSITRSSKGAVVSWPSAFADYVLQSNMDLSSTNWVDVPGHVETVGQENQVLVTPQDNVFYRLRSKKI